MRKPTVFLIVFLLMLCSTASVIGCRTQPELVTKGEKPVPMDSGIVIEMHTRTTMAGVERHLTIASDGSIVYYEDSGLRHPTRENPSIRTTRTGQLTKAELDSLLEAVNACPFDSEGNCGARTEVIDTDAVSVLTIYFRGATRTITANYQPLFHLFHTEVPELADVPEPVRKFYGQLRDIIDNNTSQISEEAISS